MVEFQLPYGTGSLTIKLPDDVTVDLIEPVKVTPAGSPTRVVEDSLNHPVDDVSLDQFASARSVAIAINDKTRPVPHSILLPPLLDRLHSLGIPADAVTFVIATGTHPPMPPEEFSRILPDEISKNYRVLSHNCDNPDQLIFLGTTRRETPVWVNKTFRDADLRIVIGNIEPHHFAGYSGGYKTASIGLTGRETINANHAWLIDPHAKIGEFTRNPLRQDIEEIGQMIGIHYAINTIQNLDREIVAVVSGSPENVLKAGIPISLQVCSVDPSQMGSAEDPYYDLVIASVGGAPKDINFYQSQKALTHASLLIRDQGVILLAAACPEGSGSRAYEDFMEDVSSPEEVLDKFRRFGFRVGPHKAFQVARELQRVKIILISSMKPEFVAHLLMTPAASPEEAIDKALQILSSQVRGKRKLKVAILPHATNTVPVINLERKSD